MPRSDFWQQRAAEFLLIPGSKVLRADGQRTIRSGETWQWRLTGGATQFTIQTFETLARRAASEIASAGTTNLLRAWLDAIREEHINFRSDGIATEVDDNGNNGLGYMFGTITDVCDASVILCRRLEATAIQTEFEEKQINHPRNWTPLRTQFEMFRLEQQSRNAPREEIPLNLIKKVISEQRAIKPEEVTKQQIDLALSELWVDYPTIAAIPEPEVEIKDIPSVTVSPQANEVERREKLLADYKAATNHPSNKKIYEARNSGLHKPQFYEWCKGTLPSGSATAINFETFLRARKPPVSRRPKKD